MTSRKPSNSLRLSPRPLTLAPAVIVVENEPYVAALLRRHSKNDFACIDRTAETWAGELQKRPGSVICWFASDFPPASLARSIREVSSRGSRAISIVATDQQSAYFSRIAFECGAVFVFEAVRMPSAATRICRHHLQSVQASSGATLVEQVWQRLPWQVDC